ncbi:hypothetical protein PIB30_115901, partial [Stylosanthes scabra]|nr:hypothetical protein [Stylosanthes scabra]
VLLESSHKERHYPFLIQPDNPVTELLKLSLILVDGTSLPELLEGGAGVVVDILSESGGHRLQE